MTFSLKNLNPLALLKALWNFLELSKLRLVVLFFVWIAIGFVLVKIGGYNGITKIFHSIVDWGYHLFISILQILGLGFVIWVYTRRGGPESDPLLDDPSFSDYPGNIYNDSSEH